MEIRQLKDSIKQGMLRMSSNMESAGPKKKLFKSYVAGIIDSRNGETYRSILSYFAPEFITSLLLYALIPLIDARWIAGLKSTSLFATVGVTNTLIHFIVKAAEGFSVGTVIVAGQYNGLGEYKEVGRSLASAFWVTCIVGGVISTLLYSGAYWIYWLYGVPEKMISLGIPFLQLKALAVFFMFIFFAFIGFLRGIKKPRIPMQIFVIGGIVFLFFDYALINGAWGFPALGLQGSAIASVIQYGLMLVLAFGYVMFNRENRKYSISLMHEISSVDRMIDIIKLSWPVVIDKTLFAAAYIWLGYLINPMGKYAIASYSVIKDLERLAIQPAAAFAQVITYLVSNEYSVHNWQGIKTNIKKVIFLSSVFVFTILIIISFKPEFFISIFDPKKKFTEFASALFPMMSVLVFFDLLQLILSGALRGAANVRVVMWARLGTFLLYFIPVSYLFASVGFANPMIKFFLIYGSFYLGNAVMSIIYIWRLKGQEWKKQSI
ncbi:MAG: Multidrug resistance protein NorM [Candidatus Dependentiae bacterium ADurb.Bin331]|nr:MAG: Multidrug resistance protein NorM [Candidatus Dependentiae bacterium ADurb.Bin331]